jgi:hypothetical protein
MRKSLPNPRSPNLTIPSALTKTLAGLISSIKEILIAKEKKRLLSTSMHNSF